MKKNIINLNELKYMQRARVVDVLHKDKLLKRRLFDLGITTGVVLQIKKKAPFGDPVSIYIRGYELCLRRSEMKGIKVEVLN